VTEVPEHLLKRSRDRRAALGLGGGGDGGGGDEAPTAAPADEPASTVVAPAAATAAAPAAAATPAVVEPPKPRPPYVQAALQRKKIPFWAVPVIAFLPVWAVIWVGGLSPASTGEAGPLELGAEIYTANCATCHGANGSGGVGRGLADGDVVKTFPDIAGQLEFVAVGSDGMGPADTPYGDPDREGGPHRTLSYNGQKMPAFGEVLTPEELLYVVRYEREVLSGEEVPPEQVGDADQRFWPDGSTIIEEGGTELTGPTGEPLFDDEGRLTVPPSYAAG
jgi:mono/diheme cytochrome c family protein